MGADEIDYVADYNGFKQGLFEKFDDDIRSGTMLGFNNNKIVKWIIETGALSKEEIRNITIRISKIVRNSFPNFYENVYIKTSTGYYGGYVDDMLSLFINIFLVMPGLPLMVILASWLPPGPLTLSGVLIVTGWAWNARVIRSQMMTLRKRDFVYASIVSGEQNIRIIMIEIMPRMLSLLASSFIGASIYAIGAQVGLEFLGLGDVSTVTWGTNLYWASNDMALLTGSWWTFVPTGLSIAIVSFALTLINFGIDEVSNPRLISERIWKKEISNSFLANGITPVMVKK